MDTKTIQERYARDGAVWPIRVFDEEQIARYCKDVEAAEKNLNLMHSDYRCKSQVLFPWLDEIIHSKAVGDVVEAILGPDFHCWDTLFWVKEPGDEKYVSYHQDATYWNFTPKSEALTVWLSFNGATAEKGAINYVLGSHQVTQIDHIDVKNENNLLMRGQTIAREVQPADLTIAEVPAGCVTIHSPFMVHGSPSNRSTEKRIACGMIFASTKCKPVATYAPESTVMVRGTDRFNYMMHDPRPTGIWETDVVAWKAAYDRQHDNYYKMSLEHAKQAAR